MMTLANTNTMMNWIQSAAPVAAEAWIASLWQGIALAVAIWLSLKLFPRISASTRFVVWSIAFFAIAFLPLLALLPHSTGTPASSIAFVPEVAKPSHYGLELSASWALVIFAIWGLAVGVQAVRLVRDLYRLRAVRNASSPLEEQDLPLEILELLRETSRQGIELRLSDTLETPSAVGFFRPAVVLPRWLWEEFALSHLKQVLVHEIAHLRRYDDWTNLLQKVVRMLLPLNPALFWIEKQLCFEREIACDDAVLGAEIAATEYATCLTLLAGKKLARHSALLAPGAVAKQSELSRRVYSLLSRTRNSSLFVARGVAATFLLATFGTALGLSQCPQWISFVTPSETPIRTTEAYQGPKPQLAKASFSIPTAAPVVRSAVAHTAAKSGKHPVVIEKLNPEVPGKIAAFRRPSLQQAGLSTPSGIVPEVVIVLSVWHSDQELQIQRTEFVFSGANSKSPQPAPAPQLQSWILFQI